MKLAVILAVVVTLGCTLDPGVSAQTSQVLNAQIYAGLTIAGSVATVYSVEYVTDLTQTNDWRCLEFLQLPANPYVWADKSAPAAGRRFYRVREFPAPTNAGNGACPT
jgi:hypothetical protein